MCAYFLPYPHIPLQPSPALPCIFGRQTGLRDLQSLRLPTGVKPLPAPSVASRILLSATSVHLCERQPATPGAPAPRGGVCGREDREGLQGSGGKGPPPRLLGWLRRSCEDSSTRKKKKKKILLHVKGERQRLQRRHRGN